MRLSLARTGVCKMTKDPIFIDTKQIERLAIELKGFEAEVATATVSALNRTIDYTVTQVGRIVPKEYAIKASEVKASFKGGIKRPSANSLEASITSTGHTLSLAHFPHSPMVPPSKKRKYAVKATIKRAGGRKPINTEPKPFIMTTGAKSDDKVQFNIFRRLGKARLPVTVIRTLSIPQMITNEKVAEQIQKAANEKMAERLEHEIIYRMTSIGKRIR